MKGLDLKIKREFYNLTQEELGIMLGKSKRTVITWEKSEELSQSQVNQIKLVFSQHAETSLNIEEATIPDTEILENKNGNKFIDLGGGLKLMTMPLLEIETQAGFADNYQDTEYLTGITEKHSIIVSSNYKGRYIAFRVKGDSMDNGKSNAILPNSIVSCRELQRHLWKDKLQYKKRPYWVISTTESSYPLLKEIVSHDIEKGIIKCHSLNDGPEYRDFELHLNEVTALFYVVDINKNVTN